MARADEALRGRRPAHRAAEVHAAAGDRDRPARRSPAARGLPATSSISGLRAAHVDRGLADLADALRGRDHARHVVVVREVRRACPTGVQMTGARSKIAEPAAKPSAGSSTAAVATAPAVCVVSDHEAATGDGLTLERARDVAVGGELGSGLLAGLRQGAGILSLGRRRAACRRARRSRSGAAPPPFGGLMVSSRTARDRRRTRVPDGVGAGRIALGVRLRAQRDHVGELGHGVEVADRREPLETERVEPIAGQQREVRILRADDPPGRRSAAGSPRGSPRRAADSPRRGRRRPRRAAAARHRPRGRCRPAGRPPRAARRRAGARRRS